MICFYVHIYINESVVLHMYLYDVWCYVRSSPQQVYSTVAIKIASIISPGVIAGAVVPGSRLLNTGPLYCCTVLD